MQNSEYRRLIRENREVESGVEYDTVWGGGLGGGGGGPPVKQKFLFHLFDLLYNKICMRMTDQSLFFSLACHS